MLYDEYVKGTGIDSTDDYELANSLYSAMPDDFTKNDMYELRKSLDDRHFVALCDLALKNQDKVEELTHRNEVLLNYVMMIKVLKDECNIDAVEVYIAHMADKAMRSTKERLTREWQDIQRE